jgi:hypothetical protein
MIMYKKVSGEINPPFDRWNWSVVIPQQFNRSANPCYLLTVLVPPVFLFIKNYLLLIISIINKLILTKKENYEQ